MTETASPTFATKCPACGAIAKMQVSARAVPVPSAIPDQYANNDTSFCVSATTTFPSVLGAVSDEVGEKDGTPSEICLRLRDQTVVRDIEIKLTPC